MAATALTRAPASLLPRRGATASLPDSTAARMRCSLASASREVSQPLCSPDPGTSSPERTNELTRCSLAPLVVGRPNSSDDLHRASREKDASPCERWCPAHALACDAAVMQGSLRWAARASGV